MQLNAYLTFNGNCEAAFKFYEKSLNGKIISMMTYEGTPAEGQVLPDMKKKIIHARMTFGDKMLMGSDSPMERFHGNHGFAISVTVPTTDEADRIFQALSEKANVQMPIQKTFWSPRFGMLIDQFGIPWMVNCEPPAA